MIFRNSNTIHFRSIAAFVLLFLFCQSFAQENDLLEDAFKNVYSNPDEAIKVGEHFSRNAQTKANKSRAYVLEAKGYFAQGNYENALIQAFAANESLSESDSLYAQSNLIIALILNDLNLKEQANIYINRSKKSYRKLLLNYLT